MCLEDLFYGVEKIERSVVVIRGLGILVYGEGWGG